MNPLDIDPNPNYLQNEQWFEVMGTKYQLGDEVNGERQLYILVINSYGKLRKLYYVLGKYEDVSDGGSV